MHVEKTIVDVRLEVQEIFADNDSDAVVAVGLALPCQAVRLQAEARADNVDAKLLFFPLPPNKQLRQDLASAFEAMALIVRKVDA